MWEKYSHIIPFIAVDSGAIDKVAEWIEANNFRNILVVCDPCTRKVAGNRVISLLIDAGLSVLECNFKEIINLL